MRAQACLGLGVLLSLLWLPTLASAQTTAGLTGVARDTTGAVLPGVTVEASSPALIEKVRTAVTDDQGRFNITDLRPGTYTVTFTLTGFSTFKRDGIELNAGFTGTANAEMKVGSLEETVTVTGASPVVDIQNVRTQQVLKSDVLEALPSGQRGLEQFAALTLGATSSTQGRNDVGGAMGESATSISLHGSRGDDARINYDGMNTNVFYAGGGGMRRIWKFNTLLVEETVIDTGGNSAESETGAANVNMVPRDGGNSFSFHGLANYTNESLSAGEVPDDLVARGSAPDQNSVKKVFDFGGGVGGPIARDRLWFYTGGRTWGGQSFGANNYFDKSTDWFRYEADLSQRAYSDFWQRDVGGRLTWQASAKHKVTTSLNWQQGCGCWLAISLGARQAPEAATSYRYGPGAGMWLSQTTWSYPKSNRLLFQAAASFLNQAVAFTNDREPGPDTVPITEQTTGYTWGTFQTGTWSPLVAQPSYNFNQRAWASYITGSHAVKAGMQTLQGTFDTIQPRLPGQVDYVFRSGSPLQIREWVKSESRVRVRSVGLYAQDQWTINRLTINAGIRYDHFWSFAKAVSIPAGRFAPEQNYPGAEDLPNFHDISPRAGVSYDLFGNGKTALKASWGRFLLGLGGGDAQSFAPSNAVFVNTDRLWTDANTNFIPDCDLTNRATNGECGAVNNPGFGSPAPVTQWDLDARTGWGVREFSYQTSVALQHELRPGLGVTVAYNRNDWRNFQAIVNTALTPADYTPYCITSPTDARLEDYSGRQICGLYDPLPAKFGQVANVRMRVEDVPGVSGRPSEVFNGLDIAVNARFAQGGVLLGGVTLGRTTFDYCWTNNLPNVTQALGAQDSVQTAAANLPRVEGYCDIHTALWNGVGSQVKLQVVYPLPYEFNVSAAFKNLPGLPIQANYVVTNAVASAALGRDLAACRGAVGAACTATTTVGVLPYAYNSGNTSAVLFDERLNQLDLRLTRTFRVGRGRLQGIAELYNVMNARPAQGISTTYGTSWLLPTSILGGRLFKFGAQVDW